MQTKAATDRSGYEVRTGANLANLPVLRSLATSIAIREDFDLDAITDIRLAVDEVCSTLILRAVPQTAIACWFEVPAGGLRFRAEVESEDGAAPVSGPFGEDILAALTDTAVSESEALGNGRHRLSIDIEKWREATIR